MARDGRPTKYKEELVKEIIERLEKNESLRSICRDDHIPERQTIYNWIMDKKDFFDRYARAKTIGYEQDVEDLMVWCDKAIENPTLVQGYKLKIDTLKWVISKKLPEKYGDTQKIVHGGEVSYKKRLDLSNLTDEELNNLERIANKLEDTKPARDKD